MVSVPSVSVLRLRLHLRVVLIRIFGLGTVERINIRVGGRAMAERLGGDWFGRDFLLQRFEAGHAHLPVLHHPPPVVVHFVRDHDDSPQDRAAAISRVVARLRGNCARQNSEPMLLQGVTIIPYHFQA